MSISDRLEQIEKRAAEATPGPWRHSVESETGETAHYVRSGGEHLAVFTGNYAGASEDGEFIAASRTDVPELVAAVRARDAALGAVLELHKPFEYSGSWEGAGDGAACEECHYDDGPHVEYPCPTVRDIERVLGGDAR